MALTSLQREILRVISAARIQAGDGYVAGGTALNLILEQPRISRDIDLFHDTRAAVTRGWQADRELLEKNGFALKPIRELPGFVEAEIRGGGSVTLAQWAVDSAFRFFPLVRGDILGLSLHPFDLATNKVLALVGRLETRDWVDVIACHSSLQELGYLAWAACGKDPGLNPELILDEAARSARYTQAEVSILDFDGPPPDAAELSRAWKGILAHGREIIRTLPVDEVGACVLDGSGMLFRGDAKKLARGLAKGDVRFHHGTIRGAFPSFPPMSSS
jgi:hypothetical protein